jgi:hypothetical protein
MVRVSLFLLLCGACTVHAQSFYGAGMSALPQSSPKPSGWAVLAKSLDSKAQVYSFTETDYTYTPKEIQSSVRTGLATPLRTIGKVVIYGVGDAGVATTGSASGSAFAGGAVALIPLPKNSMMLVVGYRALKTALGDTQQLIEIGLGRVGK